MILALAAAACAKGQNPTGMDGNIDGVNDADASDTGIDVFDERADVPADNPGEDAHPQDGLDGEEGQEGFCGDGVVDADEECDDGEGNSDDERDACRMDCTLPRCGDGVVDTGEECDDGNGVDNDACSNGCVEVLADLCTSCSHDSDCGRDVDLCTELGDGDYCTIDCSHAAECPVGFICTEILSGDVIVAEQCFPESGVCSDCYDPDGDGYGIGPECLGVDCDESDESVNPGATEICDGIDNNCISGADEGFPVGETCDGADSDLCANGTYTCRADGSDVECVNETIENIAETCDGADNDCDGFTDEDFPLLGLSCDGDDSDLCANGTYTCAPGGYSVECVNETIVNIPEVCNGLDDDCDGLTDAADAADLIANDTQLCETQVGVCLGCTKPADLCFGGVWGACGPTHYAYCNSFYEAGSETSCDGRDNDCDGTIDEMTDTDVNNCGFCGNVCNLPHATAVCSSGSCLISSCNSGYSNCDGRDDTGCEVGHASYSNNCGGAYSMGTICGDQGSDMTPAYSGRTSAWYRVYVEECSSSLVYLSTTFNLTVPAGVDYNICLWGDCGSLLGCTSSGQGVGEQVCVCWDDNWLGIDDSAWVWAEVRYVSGESCTNWSLYAEGNTYCSPCE